MFLKARYWSYLDPDASVHTLPTYIPKIHSNNILPATPRFSGWSLPWRCNV